MSTLLEYLAIATGDLPSIAGTTALLAVFFGPIVQVMMANRHQKAQMEAARRQQRASMVSSNRVRWIKDFWREIAEFIAACQLHEAERRYLADAEKDKDEKQIEHYRKALDVSFFRVNTLLHTLRLKLDPDDQERSNDAEIWDLVKRLDKLDVKGVWKPRKIRGRIRH